MQGIVTELGGKTSHTAIIARQFGIPCVVGAGSALRQIEDGQLILVDGESGVIELEPEADSAASRAAESAETLARIRTWTGPAVSADGTRKWVAYSDGDWYQ